MKKITILIGNGFNYSVKDFISDQELKSEVNDIINLWKEFDDLVKNNEGSIENIIDNLHKSFILLSIIKPFEKDQEMFMCIKNLKEKFNEEFIEKIWSIVIKFIEQEQNKGFYKRLTSFLYSDYFKSFNPCKIIKEKDISIYTTNYDGIAEIILGYDGKKIDLPDGFRSCGNEEYVCFNENGFHEDSNRSKLFHLHGSYKFFVYNALEYTHMQQEIKVKNEGLNFVVKNQANLEPIIVLNAPRIKAKQIKRYYVLSSYFRALGKDLELSDTLIIWGQSLNNDPHIEEIIKNKFLYNSHSKELIVIDTNDNHKFLSLNNVMFVDPNKKKFIDILREILDE